MSGTFTKSYSTINAVTVYVAVDSSNVYCRTTAGNGGVSRFNTTSKTTSTVITNTTPYISSVYNYGGLAIGGTYIYTAGITNATTYACQIDRWNLSTYTSATGSGWPITTISYVRDLLVDSNYLYVLYGSNALLTTGNESQYKIALIRLSDAANVTPIWATAIYSTFYLTSLVSPSMCMNSNYIYTWGSTGIIQLPLATTTNITAPTPTTVISSISYNNSIIISIGMAADANYVYIPGSGICSIEQYRISDGKYMGRYATCINPTRGVFLGNDLYSVSPDNNSLNRSSLFSGGGNLNYYNNTNGTTCVSKAVSTSGEIVIPSSVAFEGNTYTVSTVGGLITESTGWGVFQNNTTITSITIPSTVITIGQYAFSGCGNLVSATINPGGSNVNVKNYSFQNTGLTSITIPASVATVGVNAFFGCNSLTWAAVLGTTSLYGDSNGSTFKSCGNLATMYLNSGVSLISTASVDPISNCPKLTGSYALYTNSAALSTVNSSTLSALTKNIISNCYFPSNYLLYQTIDGTNAYVAGNTSGMPSTVIIPQTMTFLSFPFNVIAINSNAFAGNTTITSITIPSSVTSIGGNAFAGCGNLASATLNTGLTTISAGMFQTCSALTSITIPSSVTSIGGNAFAGCGNLASTTLNSGITSIGDTAFQNTKLMNIVIPPSVAGSMGINTFSGCTSLTSAYVLCPATIAGSSFNNCTNLTNVYLNSGVVLDNTAGDPFGNCTSLYKLYTDSVSALATGNSTVLSTVSKIPVSFTTPNKLQYRIIDVNNAAISGSSGASGIVVIPQTITFNSLTMNVAAIDTNAFLNNTSIVSVQIQSATITSIGASAFSGCSGLQSLIFSYPGITAIPANMCFNCSALTTISIPTTTTGIGESAFSGCSSLNYVGIPCTVSSIGASAFAVCSSLTTIYNNYNYNNSNTPTWTYTFTATTPTITNINTTISYHIGGDAWGASGPNGIVVDSSNVLYVATSSSTVSQYNIGTNAGSANYISATGANGTLMNAGTTNAIASDGTYIYVSGQLTSGSAWTILRYLKSGVSAPGSGWPFSMTAANSNTSSISAMVNDGTNLYVLYGINTNANSLIRKIVLSSGTSSDLTASNLAYTEALAIYGGYLYYISSATTIAQISTSGTGTVVSTIPIVNRANGGSLSNYNGMKIDSTGTYLYLTHQFGYLDMYQISGATPQYLGGIYNASTINPYGIYGPTGLDISGSYLYIANSSGNCIHRAPHPLSTMVYPINNLVYMVDTVAQTAIVGYSPSATGAVVIPQMVGFGSSAQYEVVGIDNYAFSGSSGITSVYFSTPSNVATIGINAFWGCESLSSIILPSSVTSIGANAFDGCISLYSASIPSTVSSIGNQSFQNTGLITSNMYGSVSSLGSSVFNMCTKLGSISYPNGTLPSVISSIGTAITRIVYDANNVNYTIPAGTPSGGNIYVSSSPNVVGTIIIPATISFNAISYNITGIDAAAFQECNQLTAITIPTSVVSIGDYAFSKCVGLTNLNFKFLGSASSGRRLGVQCFSYCTSLTTAAIPTSFTLIGAYTFMNCSSLTSVPSIASVAGITDTTAGNAFYGAGTITTYQTITTNY